MYSNKMFYRLLLSLCCLVSLSPRFCYSTSLGKSAEIILASMNTSVDPCEDFYKFACGSYAQRVNAELEPSEIAKNAMLNNISHYLEVNSTPSDPLPLRQARSLYKVCMNDAGRRNESFKSVARVLQQIGLPVLPPLNGVSKNFSYVYTMARSKVVYNMDFFIAFTIQRENITHFSLSLTKPSDDPPLSVSSRHWTSKSMEKEAVHNNSQDNDEFLIYARNITRIMYHYANETLPDLTTSEFNSTLKNLKLMVKFFDYLISTQFAFDYTARNFPETHSLKWLQNLSVAECHERNGTPKFDIKRYTDILLESDPAINLNVAEVTVWDTFYTQFVLYWLECQITPHELEMYLWWKTVAEIYPYTSLKTRQSKHIWCADKVNSVFPQATALMLVNNSDALHAVKKVRNMIQDIRGIFNQTITNSHWMDQPTKDVISEKLMAMKIYVGYPLWLDETGRVDDFYKEYSEVSVDENDFLTNLIKLVQVEQKTRRWKLIKTDNYSQSTFKALEVNSFFAPYMNQLVIPSGFLQFPYYGHDSAPLNFGTIGTTIGHELSHGFDSFRMEFLGALKANATKKEFSRRLQCFIDHYGNYSQPEASKQNSEIEKLLMKEPKYSTWMKGIKLWIVTDGQRTVDENMSDNSGLKITFDAYQNYSKVHGQEVLPSGLEKYSQEQLFFLAYANTHCSRHSHSSFSDSMFNEHSPDSIRVWGVLRNSEDFSKAWQCKAGTFMNPVANKCELW